MLNFCMLLVMVPNGKAEEALLGQTAPALLDNMDGQHTVFQLLPGAARVKILHHAVDRQLYRYGSGSERIRLACPAGSSAQLAYPLPNAPVIDELQVAAWVLSNRPGALLAAKVVLPRSKNLSTGQPHELLVRSENIGRSTEWEKLSLKNLPALLTRQVRVARMQHGHTIDQRGAYVSQIILLTPGANGATEIVVDRLEIYGVLGSRNERSIVQTSASATAAETRSDHLRVPQIIQWQGEPFELLAKLGFDTVGMSRLPTREELEQAKQLELSLICPPPTPRQLTEQGIAKEFSSVLAWNLGEQLSTDDLEHAIRWQQLITRYDPIDSRPTLIAPRLFTREASRVADVILLGRAMLGTDISLQDHAAWLAQRRRLARPGTEIWTTVDTQLSPQQTMQMAALHLGPTDAMNASYGQLTVLTSTAFAVKSRGFYFSSHSSLAAQDPSTHARAMALELNNFRLRLAEPWLASGKLLDVAHCSQPQRSALVLKAERSHLLVPIRWSSNMAFTQNSTPAGQISFTVPSVAESAEAYLLTLGGTQRLRHRRVTGGVRISVENLPADAFVLLTNDPQAFSQVTRFLRKIAPRATQLRRELAALRLQESSRISAKIVHAPNAKRQTEKWLTQAQLELQACDRYLASRSFDLAYMRADAVDQILDQNNRFLVSQTATNPKDQITAAVPPTSLAMLQAQLQLQKTLARAPVGANLLKGGGFENLPALLQAGWRHRQLPLDGITSSVRLSPEGPHSGAYCLELEARPLDASAPAVVVPSSPVWITSAPVHIRAGDLVEITGVARVPQPLIGSVDGLQIIDSLGGPDMALRIPQAPSWQPFRLIRAAPSDGELTVSIALTGLGKAQIDDVAIRTTRVSSR